MMIFKYLYTVDLDSPHTRASSVRFIVPATLDGTGPIRQAISITLPCLMPIIGPSVMITLFTTFKQFDVIYLMTQQVGSQTGAHIHTIIIYA